MKAKGLCFETALSMRTEPADLVLADTSRYGSDGDFAGAGQPNWVQEPSGLWVLDFNSANPDYIEIPAVATQLNFTSEDFSLIMRIYIDALTTERRFFQRGLLDTDGYYYKASGDGRLIFRTNQSGTGQESYSAIGDVIIATWYTIGMSRSGTSVIIYLDGITPSQTAVSHTDPATCARTTKIGIADNKSSYSFDGKIAYLAIWNYALSAGQHLKKHQELLMSLGV